jgi:membrane protease YdiL (CAAX protease family)
MEFLFPLLLACLPVGLIVYGRLIGYVRQKGGRVKAAEMSLPDALFTIVMVSFFGFNAVKLANGDSSAPRVLSAEQICGSTVFFVILVATLLAFLAYRKIDVLRFLGLRRFPKRRLLVLAVGFMLAAYPLVTVAAALVQAKLGPKTDEQAMVGFFRHALIEANYPVVALVLFVAALVQPALEEILFRGYFYAVGKRFMGGVGSAALTSLAFAAMHDTLAGLAPLFVLALCFTLAYEVTGSILVPTAMHMLFNLSQLAVLIWQAQAVPPP